MGLVDSEESPETVALIFGNLVLGEDREERALNQNLRNCHESETSPPPPRRLPAEIAHLGILTLIYGISS